MILIGMFDSPYVRRVAVSLDRLGLSFEHRNWSVGRDFDRIREYSPLGRVPVLITDSGEALTESSMILEHLDDLVGPARALMPAAGAERRAALRLMGLATGAVDKGIQIVIERIFRPVEKRHEPYVDRCRLQMRGALSELDQACAAAVDSEWLVGDRLSQADITFTCFSTYVREAVPHPLDDFPALAARNARYEALPLFAKYHIPFDAPVPA
jgi:glutathione S-transferase